MKKIYQYRKMVMFLVAALIVAIMTSVFSYTWLRVYSINGAVAEPVLGRGNDVLVGMYAVLCILFFKLMGCFRVGYLRVYDTLFHQFGAVLCVNGFMYVQLCLTCRWSFGDHIGPMVAMTGVDVIISIFWALICRAIYTRVSHPRDLLVIYGEYRPDNLVHKLSSRPDKYLVKEAISYETDMGIIQRKIKEHGSVVLTDIPSQLRNDLLKFCYEHDIRCYCVPKISDIMVIGAARINLFDTPLLLMRNHGISLGQRSLKRAFDIVASIVGLILASPVMLIIALCIKLYDGGPVFFTQDRLTKDGKIFKILKFRSMRVDNGHEGYCLTRKNDERVTPVGKILRNIHFDELPQLINILKGDMSVVGPRPECPDLAEEYRKMIPEFHFRLKVRAGLTGFAQVYGKYNTTPYDKLKLDLTYIERYSFLLDLQLIAMTLKILFQKENTEGIESWQTTAATKDNLEKMEKERVENPL